MENINNTANSEKNFAEDNLSMEDQYELKRMQLIEQVRAQLFAWFKRTFSWFGLLFIGISITVFFGLLPSIKSYIRIQVDTAVSTAAEARLSAIDSKFKRFEQIQELNQNSSF